MNRPKHQRINICILLTRLLFLMENQFQVGNYLKVHSELFSNKSQHFFLHFGEKIRKMAKTRHELELVNPIPKFLIKQKVLHFSKYGKPCLRSESRKCGTDVKRKTVTMETQISVTRCSIDSILEDTVDLTLLLEIDFMERLPGREWVGNSY